MKSILFYVIIEFLLRLIKIIYYFLNNVLKILTKKWTISLKPCHTIQSYI